MRRWHVAIALYVCIAATTAGAAAQTTTPKQSKVWTNITLDTDNVTNRTVLSMTATVPVAGSSDFYQFTMKCASPRLGDAGTLQSIDISTFSAGSTARTVPWLTDRYAHTSKAFQYRIDNGELRVAVLNGQYANSGRARTLFMTSIPKTRLVIVNIFDDETVEVVFDVLTPETRTLIEDMCSIARS
jgi:hypothetical protein